MDRDKKALMIKMDKNVIMKGRRTKKYLYKMQASCVEDGADEEPAMAIISVEATNSKVEGLVAGSYE